MLLGPAVAFVLSLHAASAAAAATLWSGPLFASTTSAPSCALTNVGKKPIAGMIRIHSAEGIVVQEQAFALEPRRVRSLSTAGADVDLLCEFDARAAARRHGRCSGSTAPPPPRSEPRAKPHHEDRRQSRLGDSN